MRAIRKIVHHYSATYPDQDIGVAEIREMHRKRGWRDVGYHYVIRRDGTIERGRPESEVGAHVSGHNADSIGICCIGGIERATGPNVGVDNRTAAQREAAARLTRELLTRYPGADVVGHRDLAATQCPGFDVRSWWAEVNRPQVIHKPALPPKPTAEDGAQLSLGILFGLAILAAAAFFLFN